MSLALIKARTVVGVDAPEVNVEVHLSPGLPSFNIVGLPEASVREARYRVRSALINSYYEFPGKKERKISLRHLKKCCTYITT